MRVKTMLLVLIATTFLAAACQKGSPSQKNIINSAPSAESQALMTISSPDFENQGDIPSKFTCDGENINSTLEFKDIPNGAKTLALLMDDPDVPKNLKPDGVFDHWTVFNMPASTKGIMENTDAPGVTGKNGAGQNKYTGPCPPDREHHYFFKLYALDTELALDANAGKQGVLNAMNGHILAQAELIGKYNKLANRK